MLTSSLGNTCLYRRAWCTVTFLAAAGGCLSHAYNPGARPVRTVCLVCLLAEPQAGELHTAWHGISACTHWLMPLMAMDPWKEEPLMTDMLADPCVCCWCYACSPHGVSSSHVPGLAQHNTCKQWKVGRSAWTGQQQVVHMQASAATTTWSAACPACTIVMSFTELRHETARAGSRVCCLPLCTAAWASRLGQRAAGRQLCSTA